MAIDSDSYSSVADIEARADDYTNSSGNYDTTTTPTLLELEAMIDDVSSMLNLFLAESGFAIPVSDTDSKRALDLLVTNTVVELVEAVHAQGRFAAGAYTLREGLSINEIIDQELSKWVERHADGLERLGATRTYVMTYGLSFRTEKADGTDLVHTFGSTQFGNKRIDHDSDD